MRDYVIVSDATLDLPYSVITEHNIRVIPWESILTMWLTTTILMKKNSH